MQGVTTAIEGQKTIDCFLQLGERRDGKEACAVNNGPKEMRDGPASSY